MDRYFISKINGKIQWKYVNMFINEIAKKEHQLLLNEYFVRNKMDNRVYPEETSLDKSNVFQNVPTIYRSTEKYICPDEPYWEDRYYKSLFGFKRTPDNIKALCINYIEGLEWVLKYYLGGCPNWKWKYNYHYPPLFADLCKYIPQFEMDFIKPNFEAFSPYAQLSYVLPSAKLNLLPKKYFEFLKQNYPELYPDKYDFEWSFCRYFWEAHPVLPDISVELLEQWNIQFSLCEAN
jgi:5'-3' exonuclease